jgi:two-component system, cell cycle sensor histidine kinase and response regulator CckA
MGAKSSFTTGESPQRVEVNTLDRQMLSNILAACPVGLCQVQDRKFQWVNPAMVRMFGFDCEEDFVRKSTRILYASDEEYEKVGAALYTCMQGDTEFETDAELIRKDGSVFQGHIRISSPDPTNLIKETIIAITDRTPIKEAEAALIESERRFREILENVRLVAICLDIRGNITFCNDFLLGITGWQRDEILGRSWFDIFAPLSDRAKGRQWYEPPSCDGIQHSLERHLPTKSGELRCIRWNTTIFLRDPLRNAIGVASIGEDVTEQKRANELVLRTERIKAVGDMAGAVAHNFNNLLQIVMSGGQVALKHLESGKTGQVRPEIEQIVRACDLGAETIKRLQDFSKVWNETTESDHTVFDLSHTLRQVVEMTRPWWKIIPEKDGVTISLTTDLAEGCLVRGKENELFEVAVNLMKNATEACSKGGKINVRLFADKDHVVFQVQDDGVGIDEANLEKIFQPFWTTKGFQGTGMGLSSSYGIVTRHGGDISAESIESRGTTFTVTLPKTQGQTDVRTQAVSKIPDENLRILVVDDVDALLKTIEDGLALYGQDVFTATSGKEALAIFNEKSVDVVICDLGMEGMNGWEVSRALKEICVQKKKSKPPFILLTGWGGQLSENSADQSGVDRVLSKPLSIFTLLEVIQEVVDKNEQKVSRRLACRHENEACET